MCFIVKFQVAYKLRSHATNAGSCSPPHFDWAAVVQHGMQLPRV